MIAIYPLIEKFSHLAYLHSIADNQRHYQRYTFNITHNNYQFQCMGITLACLFLGTSLTTWLIACQIPAFLLYYHGVFLAQEAYRVKEPNLPPTLRFPINLTNHGKKPPRQDLKEKNLTQLRSCSWIFQCVSLINLPASIQTPILLIIHRWTYPLIPFGFQEAFNREFKKNPKRDDIENTSTYIFKALSLILTFGYLSSPILKFIPQSGYYLIFSQIAYASFITSACLWVIQWLIAAKHINLEEMIFHNHKLAKTTSLSSRLYYLCDHAQTLIKLPISLTLRLWLFSMQSLSFVAYKLSFHKISPWISNNFTLLLALSCSLTWIIPAVQSSPTALSLLTNPYFVTASILCLFSLRLLRPFMKKNIKALLYLNGLIIPWRIHNLRVTALTAYQYYIARPFRKIAKNNKVTHIPQNNFDEATSIMNPIGVIDELKEEKASDDFCISQDHFYYLIVFSIHSYFNLITEKAGSLMDLLFKSFHQIIHPQTVNTLCLTLEHGLGAVLNSIRVLYQTLNIVGNLALSIVLTYHPITQKTMSDQLQENWNTLSQLPIDLALNLLHTGKNALLSMYQISLNILNLGKMAIHSLYRLTLFSLKTSGELVILPLYPGYLMAKSLTLHKATHSKARNTIMLRNKIENPRNKKTITPK